KNLRLSASICGKKSISNLQSPISNSPPGVTMANENNIPYEESDLYRIRHSAAHVMAEAVLELYPEAKLAIGPPIDDGFYYDFDLGKDEDGKPITFSPEDLEEIEKRMKALLKKNAP